MQVPGNTSRPAVGDRRDQHEAADPVAMIERQPQRHGATIGMGDDYRPLQIERVNHAGCNVRLNLQALGATRPLDREAHARPIIRGQLHVRRQQRDDGRHEYAEVRRRAVNKQDVVTRAPLGDMRADATGLDVSHA